MLDLSEITKRAKEAPRQTVDVEVIFDTGISTELDELRAEQDDLAGQVAEIEGDLQDQLELLKRDQRVSDPRPGEARKAAKRRTDEINARLGEIASKIEDVEGRAADFLVTFRFTALHGFEWTELTGKSLPRDGQPEDSQHGFNVDEVARVVATRSGVRVAPDGTLIDINPDEWAMVWETLPPFGLREIRYRLIALHEYAPLAARQEAVVAARKASTGRPGVTPSSLSDSASTRGASPAGNPSRSPTTSTETTAA